MHDMYSGKMAGVTKADGTAKQFKRTIANSVSDNITVCHCAIDNKSINVFLTCSMRR